MPFQPGKLQSRLVPSNETTLEQWVIDLFLVPDESDPTGEKKRGIKPNEKIDIIGFESATEAENFNRFFVPRIAEYFRWGLNPDGSRMTNSKGHNFQRCKGWPVEVDGQQALRVMRRS